MQSSPKPDVSEPRVFSLEAFRRPSSATPTPTSTQTTTPTSVRRIAAQRTAPVARINRASSQSMRAAHTILDPAAIIKELLENALDANASRVDIRVRGKAALDSITVSDNGCGIPTADYASLCLPNTTSKIASFEDLDCLATFGFRGEALSAICALAKSASVTTRTAEETVATCLRYSPSGQLTDQSRAARPRGTTVQIESIFHALPVRRKEAVKNHAREIARCVAVVQALALIAVDTRVELRIGTDLKVINLPSMPTGDVLPASDRSVCLRALRANAGSVLGTRTATALVDIASDAAVTVSVPLSAQTSTHIDNAEIGPARDKRTAHYACHGLVSKAALDSNGCGGRAKSSHQYVYVNRRPVDFPRLTRAVKDLYRRATGFKAAAPVVILNLLLPSWSCDVNLAPDKRLICVHEEDRLIAGILGILEKIWIPTTAAAIPVQRDSNLLEMLDPKRTTNAGGMRVLRHPRDGSQQTHASAETEDGVPLPDHVELDRRRLGVDNPNERGHAMPSTPEEAEPRITLLQQDCVQPERGNEAEDSNAKRNRAAEVLRIPSPSAKVSPSSPQDTVGAKLRTPGSYMTPMPGPREALRSSLLKGSTTRNVTSFIARRSRRLVPAKRPRSDKFVMPPLPDTTQPLESEHERPEATNEIFETGSRKADVAESIETVYDSPRRASAQPDTSGEVPVVPVDWEKICSSYTEMVRTIDGGTDHIRSSSGLRAGQSSDGFQDATLGNSDIVIVTDAQQSAADRELSRLFRQEWFLDLEILGQFNRGFIIVRRDKDLFIIDQHASDEKYNFEDLQRNTVISKQRLVRPLALEMSAQDEVLVLQHLSAFKAGGFDIEYRAGNVPTKRLFLTAQPISKHTIFVQDDLRDIVDMLKTNVVQSSTMTIKMLRPPRVRAMFASRACRKSIMIGTALQKPQMQKVVRNLAKIEHPWTCPHGRPTMRHLCCLPS